MVMTGAPAESFDLGPIRPPSEAFSLLIRATRNCPWNRCKFCPIYKGTKFQLRSVAEIKRDIDTARVIYDRVEEFARQSGSGVGQVAASVCDRPPNDAYRNVALWMYAGGRHAFLQDANTLIMKTAELVEVIKYLKQTFPTIDRITSYARSDTASRKTVAELTALREAGLSRLHIGMESGCDPVLAFMDKGVTAAEHISAGRKVVASGISLSEYVILGAGGRRLWREHALETARVLNEIQPDFIRFRTLTVQDRMILHKDVLSGEFIRATDEEIVAEEKLLIENLECHAEIASDHIINLLAEVEGKLPEDREKMLAVIGRFQSLSPEEQLNFKAGRRLGIYNLLDDLNDSNCREAVQRVIDRIHQNGDTITDELIFQLMERYI